LTRKGPEKLKVDRKRVSSVGGSVGGVGTRTQAGSASIWALL
jgi:hypothetical protein